MDSTFKNTPLKRNIDWGFAFSLFLLYFPSVFDSGLFLFASALAQKKEWKKSAIFLSYMDDGENVLLCISSFTVHVNDSLFPYVDHKHDVWVNDWKERKVHQPFFSLLLFLGLL